MLRRTAIHPIHDRLVQRTDKEVLLGQRGCVVWMTGLSGSGKSTIAIGLERRLHEQGLLTLVLDGDNVRTGINNNLGFSAADRTENIRRIAEVAAFAQSGVVTICCFISPTVEIRQQARMIIGADDFIEVFIDTPLEECEARDVKGLYARPGRSEGFHRDQRRPFEALEHPDIHIATSGRDEAECITDLYERILLRVKRADVMHNYRLTHLKELESESIHILREVAARSSTPHCFQRWQGFHRASPGNTQGLLPA
ncbi:MAG: adenylyl-sulfate kinase [Flavobacteriales bacterium]|nr:adenylyl-sulfate kinase [Flavobacteriales bacterium]